MVAKADAKQGTAEVETPAINWGEITDLASARAALGNVVNISELLGDGSEFIDDKDKLVGTPFLVLDWRFIVDKDTGREYVNVMVMGTNGEKARFNDGGEGVYKQLKQVSAQVGKVGMEVRGGLRRSDYTFTGQDGKTGKATTFYLSV